VKYDIFFYFGHDDNTVSLLFNRYKKDWFLQVLGFNLECQFACKNMVLVKLVFSNIERILSKMLWMRFPLISVPISYRRD